MKHPFFFLFGLSLFAVACGGPSPQVSGSSLQEAWKPHDAPINLGPDYERDLVKLPSSGELSTAPWADSYWPSYEGGISARWASDNPQPFTYTSPSLSQLKSMDSEALAELSPAEKFDILRGDYSYPLVQLERSRTSPDAEGWEGICHGWAPASMLYKEPQPITIENADGIKVPFGSADVKALLSYYQGQIARPQTEFLGLRCNIKIENYDDARANADDCKGVNAGAFHIVLANQIGLRNEGFVADVTRDFEVWNHPISAFRSSIQSKSGISPTAAPGTVREVQVETVMFYVVESSPQWNSLVSSDYTTARTYRYTLELDASGAIIGGEWQQDDRPDFLWKQGLEDFRYGFEALENLYQQSTGG